MLFGQSHWVHRHPMVLSLLAITGLVLATHIPSLDNFFWLDDFFFLQSAMNAVSHPANIFYDRLFYGFFRPLALGGCLMFYKLFGLNPMPYHLGSMLTHTVNACLVYALGWTLTRDHAVGTMAGLLFAVHRAHTISTFQTLALISELLCFFFYVSCLIAYLSYLRTAQHRYYTVAIVMFLLASLTKESAISLLPILLLCDVLLAPSAKPGKTAWRLRLIQLCRRQAPFITLFILYAGYQKFFVQTEGSLFYRELLSIEPNARVTHAQDFTPLKIGIRFIGHLFDYLVSLVFPVEGGGYKSQSLGMGNAIILIRTVLRYGMLVFIPLVWMTGRATTRFLVVWIVLSFVPTALLYYTPHYRHIYIASAGFSILVSLILLQVYRTVSHALLRTVVISLAFSLLLGHSILTLSDERLTDARGRFYRDIVAALQARYPHLDNATTLYIIDGPGHIEEAIQIFCRNPTLIIRVLDSRKPQEWPPVPSNSRHLIFRVTPTGLVESRL